MPDAPDWYTYRLESGRHVLADLAELAVRIGGVSSYDRRGSVLWQDSFKFGIGAYVYVTGGTGSKHLLSWQYAVSDGLAMRLYGGSDGAQEYVIYKNFAPQEVNKWGLELALALMSDFDRFDLQLIRYDGTDAHVAKIILDKTNGEIRYRDTNGDEQAIATLPTVTNAYGVHHNLKVVGDYDNDKYVRLMFNNTIHSLADIGLYVHSSSTMPACYFQLRMKSRSGENDYCSLDRVIVTTDEP